MSHTPGPWLVNTLNGRVPIVRRVKMPHGEADTYTSTIIAADGNHVCRLDFGYGRPVNEKDAMVLAAAPDLLEALKVARASLTALMNAVADREYTSEATQAWADAMKAKGLKDIGITIDAALAKAEGLLEASSQSATETKP